MLDYRLSQQDLASSYANVLKELSGVEIEACERFDVCAWWTGQVGEARRRVGVWERYCREICRRGLLDGPRAGEGWEFSKPEEYLAVVCVEMGWEEERVVEVIKQLAMGKLCRKLV